MGRAVALFAALAWGAPALAQEPSGGAQVPPSLGADLSWQRVGLVGAGVCDLAVIPAETGIWAAIGTTGEVWVTRDAGATFTRVLAGPGPEVDPRRRIEARIQELIDDLGAALEGASGYDGDTLDEGALEVLQREIGTLQDQLQELSADENAIQPAARSLFPRVWAFEEALFAGRSDGLWRSEDLGASWRRVLDVATHGLARVPGRALWTAGTDDGIRVSADGVAWTDVDDGTESVQVADLAAGQDGVWAATSDGLWFAPDGRDWKRVGAAGRLHRVLPDPDWVRGAWVAAPDAVLRTDDGGKTLSPGLGAQIPGVSSLLWLGAGHVLAASADGVWASVDGGVTWSSRSRGLTDPDTRALAQDGPTLLLAAGHGIFRLASGPPAEEVRAARPVIPLAPLLAAATERPELSQKTGNRWAATVLPRLTVNFDWVDASALDWALLTGTVAAGGTAWGASVGLTWTPRAQTNLDDALLPIDAVWLANNGPMSQAFAASTTRDAVRYRVAVTQTVADLYFARADLESIGDATTSLDEAVDLVLRVAEIDARLDLMTDGALSRLRFDPTRENP